MKVSKRMAESQVEDASSQFGIALPEHLVGATGDVARALSTVGPGGILPPISPRAAARMMEAERVREQRGRRELPPQEVPCQAQ